MAFVDEVTFHVKAGKGGSGVERWLHEKGKEFMGEATSTSRLFEI
jgi:GTPase involved in cell partitioning and DNA repair